MPHNFPAIKRNSPPPSPPGERVLLEKSGNTYSLTKIVIILEDFDIVITGEKPYTAGEVWECIHW